MLNWSCLIKTIFSIFNVINLGGFFNLINVQKLILLLWHFTIHNMIFFKESLLNLK